ncbi:MAG: lactate utilization protein B, partial [Alphaproteobacteria bacterium]|nr:lactate utilization protein B [Alphaproteobacteria bacterium]
MTIKPEQFSISGKQAMANKNLQATLRHISDEFIERRNQAIAEVTAEEWQEWRNRATEIKDHSLAHLDIYLEAFEKNLTAAGGQLHWCMTPEEANETITAICRQHQAQLVVKSKSMVSEEIQLNDHLTDENIKVVETDLGEYIIQLRGEKPSHIIAPAMHLTQEMVANSFRHHHMHLPQKRRLEDIDSLLAEARTVLRKSFLTADVGITGANFLVAESGSVVLVTNEGNGDLVATLPRVHIVLTTIDKVVPTLFDAVMLTRMLGRSATGQAITSYTTLITGKKKITDSDGGSAYHVVLLNNNRTQLLDPALRASLRCIKCGACLNHCPIYQTVGGHSYGGPQMGPIGAVVAPAIYGIKKSNDLVFASTLCGRCEEVCPVKIPIPNLLRHQREWSFLQKTIPTSKQKQLR